jgi:uncharacterized protein YdaU (DUF1376 family)
MSSRPWMPLYVADYRADTAHLSTAQHGAYLLLIMHYWMTGGLSNDDVQLARIACMTAKEWGKARPVIAALFSDGWKHKRIEHELTEAARISMAGKAGGEASGRARRERSTQRNVANDHERSFNDLRTTDERSANDSPTIREALHSPSHTQRKKKKDSIEAREARSKSKPSRLPADWQPSEADLTFAQQAGFALLDSKRLADDFRDYWHARAGPQGLKLDWPATWRRWVRTAAERRGNGTGPQRSQRGGSIVEAGRRRLAELAKVTAEFEFAAAAGEGDAGDAAGDDHVRLLSPGRR